MEDINHHIPIYKKIFLYLLLFTVVTVGVSYIDFGIAGGIFIGLLIASVKGFLVAANFMHLNAERGLIYFIKNCSFYICFYISIILPVFILLELYSIC